MKKSKHYIIVDNLSPVYKYNIDSGNFSSNINIATLRTYKESEKMLISIYFYKPLKVRKCTIENIRKVKLEMLNKIYERA